MILSLLRARKRAPARTPPGTRIYAVGDIHGRADLLERLVETIQRDTDASSAARNVVVFIGDYVDRGLDSRAVVDFLLAVPLAQAQVVFLKGNHDAWLLQFLREPRAGVEWLSHGGQATLLSYGVRLDGRGALAQRMQEASQALALALPATHHAFLSRLSLTHVEGDYLFVHAGIRPGVQIEHQVEDDLLWIRDEFTADSRDHGYTVIHGHNVTETPDVRPNRVGIDTGAFATGRLTCLVLEDERRRFLTT